MDASRYIVGIDLGTTNSAVCFVDASEQPWRVRTFAVPQCIAPGQVESRETLPSFHYEPATGEMPPGGLRLPWQNDDPPYTVGTLAREQGRLVPGRLIDSAKSWLCHTGVDRTAPLLPWHGAPDVESLSPVEVSARYLRHIREAWDAQHAQFPLAAQDVVITLPASFDEIARQLTVDAARQAGLPRIALIEEPQAAFYSWLYAHRDDWEQHVTADQSILVCDIGGGTSDFSLIRTRRTGQGDVEFQRVAVGEHLILGGDNLDLALAHHLEERLTEGGKLEPRQWSVLVRNCRHVKETLLGVAAPEYATVNLPGGGSRLIGGGRHIDVSRDETIRVLVDGFLPDSEFNARPRVRQSGFQEFGLPYAADHAITRYLAAFLTDSAPAASSTEAMVRPDLLLFNGGFFASPVLRARLLDVMGHWFRSGGREWEPQVLENERLDLAVARGAAYFGMVRRGEGVRIAAGLPRTYYVGVESVPPSAVCLMPAGTEPGEGIDLTEHSFELRVSAPVEFPLYVSATRTTDAAGELVAIDPEQMTSLPPIRTVLKSRRHEAHDQVAVTLHARLSEIGTLELWCSDRDGPRSWQLQFDVRSATETDRTAHTGEAEREGVLDRESVQLARQLIADTFGPNPAAKPGGLPKRIAAELQLSRGDWPASLLRELWDALLDHAAGRKKSAEHEARWLNLLGFALRPGYGLAADDWRVAETWRLLQGKLLHHTSNCWAEWWVMWRRIAGGLTAGQQQTFASRMMPAIRQMHRQLITGTGKGAEIASNTHEESEVWRMLAALERLDTATKRDLGGIILDILAKRKMQPLRPALLWAVGRIGARVPMYGPLNGVLGVEIVEEWVQRLIAAEPWDSMQLLAVMQLARRTGDRYRDLSHELREPVVDWLGRHNAPEHYAHLVEDVATLESDETNLILGDTMPLGLRIQS